MVHDIRQIREGSRRECRAGACEGQPTIAIKVEDTDDCRVSSQA